MKPDDLIRSMMRDIQQAEIRRERDKAKADPLGHKLTRVFDDGNSPRFRYWRVVSRGRIYRYCFCTNPNAAGFYLGFVEVESKDRIERKNFVSRRVRAKVKALMLARYEAHQNRLKRAKGNLL